MFVNKVNPVTGNPICICGEDCLPDPALNGIVFGTKGPVILHKACVEAHNTRVLMGF